MTAIRWMILTCLGSWLAVALVVPRDLAIDLGWGMAAPLAATAVSWWLVERAARVDMARVSQVLMHSFAAKMAFFAAYVVVMVRGLAVEPTPFILSFTVYFLALLAAEAILVRRLNTAGAAGAAGAPLPDASQPRA